MIKKLQGYQLVFVKAIDLLIEVNTDLTGNQAAQPDTDDIRIRKDKVEV